MEEVWKAVKGYEGLYEVSNLGNVRSLDQVKEVTRNGIKYMCPFNGKVLRPIVLRHGYLGVQLYGMGGHKTRGLRTMSVHRLVAEAFIPNPLGLPEVNHIDEDKANNSVDNLEWCTHLENSRHGTRGDRIGLKNKNGLRSIPVSQFTLDGEYIKTFPSYAEVERETGFLKSNVNAAANGLRHEAYGYVWIPSQCKGDRDEIQDA